MGLCSWLCCLMCGRDPAREAKKHGSMLDADQRRKQFAFQNARSHSAPPRKKWYRRGLLRRQGSHSMLYDKMVTRRLVGAIACWHDIHCNLLALEGPTEKTDEQSSSSTPSTSPADCEDESGASSPPTDAESEHEWTQSAPASTRLDFDEDSSQDESEILSDDELDEIVDFERRNLHNSRFSISNPELTNGQLKQMFPELSDHWRWVAFLSVF
ncbi:hypothetical protein M3Y99_00726400 [Aphelenchoides fujianensis]|nr:hypothetical protein M3Y99_00726400 [Aphelenchoides fujianensis]